MVLHLIGHLQKNKVGKAVKIYDYIQTVDSFELAKKIQKKANEIKKTQKIYMQINIGNIKGRYGFEKKEIYDAAKTISELENVSIESATYLQNVENSTVTSEDQTNNDYEIPKFEVDSIELASPQLFSEEEMSRETNENQDNSPNEMTMFDQTNPQENLESSTEVKESNEVKEPEMFEEKDSEDDFEIPAFLRRQKN